MKGWIHSLPYRKWKKDLVKYRKTAKKNRKSTNLCNKTKTFCKGAKNIPRRLMPQIYNHKRFSKKIRKNYNIGSKTIKLSTKSLKPSQNEINGEIVEKVVESMKKTRKSKKEMPIVVSKDGYVVDGHHRWAAHKKMNPRKKIKALKIDAPINDALGIAISTETKRDSF